MAFASADDDQSMNVSNDDDLFVLSLREMFFLRVEREEKSFLIEFALNQSDIRETDI